MAELIINRIEEGLFTHTLTVDGVSETAIDNAPNLTSFWQNGIRFLDFKTKNGAPLVKNQRILPSEITITDSFGSTPPQTGFINDVQVWTALGELGYFQGFSGGSGGGGTDTFINLTDVTPNMYLGFGGMVYIVNEEETGLIPETFYNYHLLTQLDDVRIDALSPNDVGKMLAVQMDGTTPKVMLTDMPNSGVVIPNGFTNLGEQTLVGGNYTATVGYEWNYANIHYGLIEDYTVTIDEEATGNSRIDVIHTVPGTNDLTKTVGTPSAGEGTALKPQIPVGSLELTQINIYEDNISEPTQPITGFVESVTGSSVDNTDPLNPIIKAVPLSGTITGEPITGDLEISSELYDAGIYQNFNDNKSGLFFFQDEQLRLSFDNGNKTILDVGASQINVISENENFNGIVGNELFDKQNNPNAYAQLGDLPNIVPVSATVSGIVDNTSLQELGGVDKKINNVNIGKGGGNIASNTVFGDSAYLNNITGVSTVAVGSFALNAATSSSNSVAVGSSALRFSTGTRNVAVGNSALANAIGTDNTAMGHRSGQSAKGNGNTFYGYYAGGLASSNNGNYNIGMGYHASADITTGNNNVLIENLLPATGMQTGSNNIIVNPSGTTTGVRTGSNNLILGSYLNAFATGTSNTVALGAGSSTKFLSNDAGTFVPQQTNSLIDADITGKAVITKEYLTPNLALKANDADVLHKTGNETKNGDLTINGNMTLANLTASAGIYVNKTGDSSGSKYVSATWSADNMIKGFLIGSNTFEDFKISGFNGSSLSEYAIFGNNSSKIKGQLELSGLLFLGKFTTGTEPTYQQGAIYFNTSINKIKFGGETGWEVLAPDTLTAPDGNKWRLLVSNTGVITTTPA